jgi:endonuclease/exonuclease/phosphatase family metal-dependent hydrolase
MARSAHHAWPWLAWLLLTACDLTPDAPEVARRSEPPRGRPVHLRGDAGNGDLAATAVPADRVGERLLVSWNLEWFMDAEHGPVDDVRQLNGARMALGALGAELIALQEIATPAALQALLAALPGYEGVLSSYEWPQRLALVFRAPLQLRAVREIEGLDAAGRPPLEVRLRDQRDGSELIAIVVHAKAFADESSWQRRARFAAGLHAYLIEQHAGARVIVAGDFNDQLLSSTLTDRASPYAVFVDDDRFLTPTAELEGSGEHGSTARGGALLDHILLGAALGSELVPGSADVLRTELLARDPSLSATVSDHFPVALRLR